jgi:hypothetical protein
VSSGSLLASAVPPDEVGLFVSPEAWHTGHAHDMEGHGRQQVEGHLEADLDGSLAGPFTLTGRRRR